MSSATVGPFKCTPDVNLPFWCLSGHNSLFRVWLLSLGKAPLRQAFLGFFGIDKMRELWSQAPRTWQWLQHPLGALISLVGFQSYKTGVLEKPILHGWHVTTQNKWARTECVITTWQTLKSHCCYYYYPVMNPLPLLNSFSFPHWSPHRSVLLLIHTVLSQPGYKFLRGEDYSWPAFLCLQYFKVSKCRNTYDHSLTQEQWCPPLPKSVSFRFT